MDPTAHQGNWSPSPAVPTSTLYAIFCVGSRANGGMPWAFECRDIGPAAGLRADALGFEEPFLQLPEHALLDRRRVPDQLLIRQQAILRLA